MNRNRRITHLCQILLTSAVFAFGVTADAQAPRVLGRGRPFHESQPTLEGSQLYWTGLWLAWAVDLSFLEHARGGLASQGGDGSKTQDKAEAAAGSGGGGGTGTGKGGSGSMPPDKAEAAAGSGGGGGTGTGKGGGGSKAQDKAEAAAGSGGGGTGTGKGGGGSKVQGSPFADRSKNCALASQCEIDWSIKTATGNWKWIDAPLSATERQSFLEAVGAESARVLPNAHVHIVALGGQVLQFNADMDPNEPSEAINKASLFKITDLANSTTIARIRVVPQGMSYGMLKARLDGNQLHPAQ
jgi:hypothetical protein